MLSTYSTLFRPAFPANCVWEAAAAAHSWLKLPPSFRVDNDELWYMPLPSVLLVIFSLFLFGISVASFLSCEGLFSPLLAWQHGVCTSSLFLDWIWELYSAGFCNGRIYSIITCSSSQQNPVPALPNHMHPGSSRVIVGDIRDTRWSRDKMPRTWQCRSIIIDIVNDTQRAIQMRSVGDGRGTVRQSLRSDIRSLWYSNARSINYV